LHRVSTTRGAATKTVKKLLPKEISKYFLKLIIWNKKYDVSLFILFTIKCIFLYFLEI